MSGIVIRFGGQKNQKGKEHCFVGMGISGGEEGAQNGPLLMPGGPKEVYKVLEHVLTSCENILILTSNFIILF